GGVRRAQPSSRTAPPSLPPAPPAPTPTAVPSVSSALSPNSRGSPRPASRTAPPPLPDAVFVAVSSKFSYIARSFSRTLPRQGGATYSTVLSVLREQNFGKDDRPEASAGHRPPKSRVEPSASLLVRSAFHS